MSKRDYYDVLGVNRSATEDDLKKAYRKLAMQYHPDRNQGNKDAEAKFKEINEAYDILKDPQKKAAYDQMGHAAFSQGGGGGGFHGGFSGGSFHDIFEEMFGDFMGGGRSAESSSRGSDLRYDMTLTLEEAFKGHQTQIKVPSMASCDECHGTGAEKGTRPVTCGVCRGKGRVRSQQGFFMVERTCGACHGVGTTIEKPCKTCQGQGRLRKQKTLSVTIPAGVEDGTRIRLAGEGEAGVRGGGTGDLYLFLSIKPHAFFQREEADIHCKVPISMVIAALGGTIDVPTIDGTKAKVTIPAGTQPGHQFRLKGKGMSILRQSRRGDMFIHAMVETPVNLTKKQKELLEAFRSEKSQNSPQSEGFFAKVKEFWEDLRDG